MKLLTLIITIVVAAHSHAQVERKVLTTAYNRVFHQHALVGPGFVAPPGSGWDLIQPECSVLTTPDPNGRSVPLYRATSANARSLYTVSEAEYQTVVSRGWVAQGVVGHVYGDSRAAARGTVPLYRLYNNATADHYYTISEAAMKTSILSDGYHLERIAAYVFPPEPIEYDVTILEADPAIGTRKFRCRGSADVPDGADVVVRVWYYLNGCWYLPRGQQITIRSDGTWDSGELDAMETGIQAFAAMLSHRTPRGLKEFESCQRRLPTRQREHFPATDIQLLVGAWEWSDLSDEQVRNLVRTTAPMIRFHKDEKYFPSSVEFFLRGASLYHNGQQVVASVNSSAGLAEQTAAVTGPYDGSWQLKIIDSKRDQIVYGDLKTAKAYVHLKPSSDGDLAAKEIQWWFFYPHNGNGPYAFDFVGESGAHDGDWEHVTVRVRRNGTVLACYGSAHSDESGWYQGRQLQMTETHPIMHAAQSTHAFYGNVGDGPIFSGDEHERKVYRIRGPVAGAYLWDEIYDGTVNWNLWEDDGDWVILDREDLTAYWYAWFHFVGDWGSPTGPKFKGAYDQPQVDEDLFGGVSFANSWKFLKRDVYPDDVSSIDELQALFPDVSFNPDSDAEPVE